MPESATNHIVCVGAVYIDTILTIPHFPIEDEKLRAKGLAKRRGGNTANSLEVLSQLVHHSPSASAHQTPHHTTTLHLLSVLPNKNSTGSVFIRDSLPGVQISDVSLFRAEHQDAASSYIMQSAETRSRTIISINPLPEMTALEFVNQVRSFIHTSSSSSSPSSSQDGAAGCCWEKGWFHFEGRVPEVTLSCVRFLREEFPQFGISVECEKPERVGMEEVARYADVVFYSRLWAEKNGFADARTFLERRHGEMGDGALLCCTWGAGGATAVQKGGAGEEEEEVWADVTAWKGGDAEVVDTIGAGDTFIAGMLFAVNEYVEWGLQRKLEFANELAGRKVLQEGFGGLGERMW